jgi:hypothetical protein
MHQAAVLDGPGQSLEIGMDSQVQSRLGLFEHFLGVP